MKYLAKTSLLHSVTVDFAVGRSVTFVQNMVYNLSEKEVAFLKKNRKQLFGQLLKLRVRAKPQEQVFEEIAEKIQEMLTPKPELDEFEKFMVDEPNTWPEDLVEVEVIEGDEPIIEDTST